MLEGPSFQKKNHNFSAFLFLRAIKNIFLFTLLKLDAKFSTIGEHDF